MVITQEDARIPPHPSYPKFEGQGAQFEPDGSHQLVRVTREDCWL